MQFEFQNVSYSYGNLPALKNISLKIDQGDSVVLMGANGCGKTTLLKLMAGLFSPQTGVYRYNGQEITQNKLRDEMFSKRFHQQVGFVFQDPDAQLFCADVYEEVAFGPRQMGMSENEVEKRVKDCLSLLGIEALADRSPYHLSGGEKKKTALAATLALNPETLLLDEPMSGLDPRTQRWLTAFLIQLHQAGKTLVISSHDLSLSKELAKNAVLFTEEHGIAKKLPMEDLLKDLKLLKSVNLI